ncbi:MAG: flagellin [Devosia sp.]|uniref:flagellin N-terminal helical domain-containing protein n=1 Tax=Devosia sp. TaxID=1871048 RepID=UPI0033970B30
MPVISTNIAANSAVRYLNINSADQTSSLSKLASGSRISQASDDAAGLAISTRISSDVTALSQAATNASHGISVLQTADGGASNISDILQRMKALASQSASGTVTDTERAYIDAEFSQLIDEVDGISTGTRYNGESLLDGTSSQYNATGVSVMVGSSASDTIVLKIESLSSTALGLVSGTNATSAEDIVGAAITTIDASGGDITFDVNGTTVTLADDGGAAADGKWSADAIAGAITQALAADSNTDVAVTAVDGKLNFTNTTTGSTSFIEINNFTGATAADLGLTTTATYGADATAGTTLSVSSQTGANEALTAIDAAIDTVSKARASIGALESRFSFRSDSISTSIENLQAANSAITDTDVASESAKLASAKVKTQAAVAAAAQASQMPQDLLKLLQ